MYELMSKIIEISKYVSDQRLFLYRFTIDAIKLSFDAVAVSAKANTIIRIIKRKKGNSPYNNSDNDFNILFLTKCGKE